MSPVVATFSFPINNHHGARSRSYRRLIVNSWLPFHRHLAVCNCPCVRGLVDLPNLVHLCHHEEVGTHFLGRYRPADTDMLANMLHAVNEVKSALFSSTSSSDERVFITEPADESGRNLFSQMVVEMMLNPSGFLISPKDCIAAGELPELTPEIESSASHFVSFPLGWWRLAMRN
jgi:hypothetical protein